MEYSHQGQRFLKQQPFVLKNISPDTRCCVVTWLEGVKINNSSIFESDLGFRGEGLVSNAKKVLYFATCKF